MVSEKMAKALSEQINAEYHSAYLYLSMANHFDHIGRSGVAHWFQKQAEEELTHGEKIRQYLLDKGNKPEIKPIKEVKTSWDSILEAFQDGLAHEQLVTSLINKLVILAQEEDDFATEYMLHWFVTEQVEEEDVAGQMISDLKLIGNDGAGLYHFDIRLGER